jgi:serpin B
MRETPGGISLPEFKLEYGTRLNDALSGLGMGVAFDRDRADFTDMTDGRRVWIDRAEHKTVMDVNERGTQASAATASLIMKGPVNLPMPGGFDMVVDHPFLCAIVDNQTGAIIFLGAITDPRA